MKQFKVKEGSHVEEGREYTKGQTVTSPHDLCVLFPQKFEFLGEVDTMARVPLDEDEEATRTARKKTARKKAARKQTTRSTSSRRKEEEDEDEDEEDEDEDEDEEEEED